MCCSFPVPLSFAFTFNTPFASMSKVTSICGTHLGAGAIESSINLPRDLLSAAISLSHCNTLISTLGWLSTAVEKVSDFEVGIVVFLGIILVATPHIVSIESDNGVTSRSNTSVTSHPIIPAWIAAPIATDSSGLIHAFGFFPKNSSTFFTTSGTLVDPHTNNTWSKSEAESHASFNTFLHGSILLSTRSEIILSNFALVMVIIKFFGPLASTVIYGRLISYEVVEESSFFAFSASSLTL